MAKFKVQRLVKVWIEDVYDVDEITQEAIDAAIEYDIDADDYDTLWDSMEELGSYEVFDNENNLIYTKHPKKDE